MDAAARAAATDPDFEVDIDEVFVVSDEQHSELNDYYAEGLKEMRDMHASNVRARLYELIDLAIGRK